MLSGDTTMGEGQESLTLATLMAAINSQFAALRTEQAKDQETNLANITALQKHVAALKGTPTDTTPQPIAPAQTQPISPAQTQPVQDATPPSEQVWTRINPHINDSLLVITDVGKPVRDRQLVCRSSSLSGTRGLAQRK
jgi:hypothetical protein